MSSSVAHYASPISPHVYYPGSELEGEQQGWAPALDYTSQPPHMTYQSYSWSADSEHSETSRPYPHSSIDIVQPAPTRRIDAKYLEPHSVSQSPEMVHPSVPQPQYHHHHQHQMVSWSDPAAGHEYHCAPYSGPHIEHPQLAQSGYYDVSQHGYFHGPSVPYSTFSPYAHMQPSSYCPPTYVHTYPTTVYGYPIITPPESRRNSYTQYTPASSNPSSGNTSPQFEPLDSTRECDNVNGTDGSETLMTPITPSLHPQPYPGMATLLLAQSGISSEPITMYHHHQEAYATFEPRPAHHEAEFQGPVGCLPLSPVSPVLEHPHAAKQEYVETPVPTAPATPPKQTTTFVVESGQPEEPLALLTDIIVDGAPGLVQSQAQAAERLKKLRERRHVVACTFCRGRKIACHSPILQPTETDDGVPAGVTQPSNVEHDDEYNPKAGATVLRRGSSATVERPPCENCIRRGRECVYPPRVPRVPRRRRKAGTAAPVQSTVVERQPSSPRYPALTNFLQ